jgi:peptidoglycan/xylan/chitin deacetylase (PgdA/CDA1 family)
VFLADIPILCYHQITEADLPKNPECWGVPLSQFERQVRYLHDHGYRCISLPELLSYPGNQSLPKKKVFALTFDDGYEDFFTLAYPVLQRYGITATVFLVTDCVGGLSHWEGEEGTPMLTWEQVEILHADGISFGSHTCTHPLLPHLSNEQIWHELAASKAYLEARLGQEISWLAYPYGDSNGKIQELARAVGYRAACGFKRGKSGPFNLWRYLCRADDSLLTFVFNVMGWYRYSRWLREETVVGQFLRQTKHRVVPRLISSLSK